MHPKKKLTKLNIGACIITNKEKKGYNHGKGQRASTILQHDFAHSITQHLPCPQHCQPIVLQEHCKHAT